MRNLLTFLCLCICTTTAIAQNKKTATIDQQWRQVDSLIIYGYPVDAQKIVLQIQDKATTANDKPNILRAQLLTLHFQLTAAETEETQYQLLQQFGKQKRTAVEQAIVYNFLADAYWNIYENNRWEILEHTNLATMPADANITTWTEQTFTDSVVHLLQLSIQDKAALEATAAAPYLSIFTNSTFEPQLTKNLYELLVKRALRFYTDNEHNISKPTQVYVMSNPDLLGDIPTFIAFPLGNYKRNDPNAAALRLYQQLLQAYQATNNQEALAYYNLQRLKFVAQKGQIADVTALHYQSLVAGEKQFPNTRYQSVYAYEAVQLQENDFKAFEPNNTKPNYPTLLAAYENIITTYPNSIGASSANSEIESIKAASLTIEVEDVIPTKEYAKFLLKYKNMDKVYIKVVKHEPYVWNEKQSTDEFAKKQYQQPALYEAAIDLINPKDYEKHSTEIKLDPLSAGQYTLYATTTTHSKDTNFYYATSTFRVSDVATIQNAKYIQFLHRKTGEPIPKVSLQFRKGKQKKASYISGTDGKINHEDINNYDIEYILYGQEKIEFSRDYYGYNSNQEASIRTQLFTDRAIYRPGQTIHFKGIVINHQPKTKDNKVIPNKAVQVSVRNANGEIIKTIDLTTNAFGSFTGTFVAPENGLLGYLSIGTGNGSVAVSVEEYKRPKFYVEFDTLRATYKINETITVKGNALAYAGNATDGATVKYTVTRQNRFPYPWRCYWWPAPTSNRQVMIKEDSTTVNTDGSFSITFQATPDSSIALQSWPSFYYTVQAIVTDINGETHEATQGVSVGYKDMLLSASIPETSSTADLKAIRIATTNNNGYPQEEPLQVNVYALDGPTTLLKKRYWQQPDLPIYDEAMFKKWFPYDVYAKEDQPNNYKRNAMVASTTLTNTEATRWDATKNITNNGWYEIEIIGRDSISQKYYTYYFEPTAKSDLTLPLIVRANKTTLQPKEQLKLGIYAGAANVPVQTYTSKVGTTPNWNPNEFTIQDADRGGIAYVHYYVWQNRYYEIPTYITIPYTNKELDITWASHRDKLTPGATEQWSFTIKGQNKEKVAAEMMATLYDASLDALKPYSLAVDALNPIQSSWMNNRASSFGTAHTYTEIIPYYTKYKIEAPKRYEEDNYSVIYGQDISYNEISLVIPNHMEVPAPLPNLGRTGEFVSGEIEGFMADAAGAPNSLTITSGENNELRTKLETETAQATETNIPQIRTNFKETAFFKPDLLTDAEGNITFTFTIPEALTKWNLVALAHTKDWSIATLKGSVQTQKELMVMPNIPRFFRQDDEVVLATKVVNLSDKALEANVKIEILNAKTLQSLQLPFRIQKQTQNISIAQGASAAVTWTLHIPETIYEPVIVRIVADAGSFSDGEEHYIPVVTNRTLVTESITLPMLGNGTKAFKFDALLDNNSKTLAQHALTVEYTSNPTWLVVQALPYLTSYPYECAEQTFSKFYGNALAADIANKTPKIKAIFEQWSAKDSSALLSNLEQNESLKSALLEETPWVMEAQNESEQKQRLALLFQTNRMEKDLKKSLDKLKALQNNNGAFPWFGGLSDNRYITQTIVLGISKMQALNIQAAQTKDAQNIVTNAMPYLHQQLSKDYQDLTKSKLDKNKQHISDVQLQQLYIYSLQSNLNLDKNTKEAYQYYLAQAKQYWNTMSIGAKAKVALIMAKKDQQLAQNIVASLRQNAIVNEEMGMYWKANVAGYFWYEAPIENQALLIEAFRAVDAPANEIAAMQTWLIKNKQTNRWHSTKATVDATYAILGKNIEVLGASPKVQIQLGDETISSDKANLEAGTGYLQQQFAGAQVRNNMGDIRVTVADNNAQLPSWGAVYWQYFEQTDKLKNTANKLQITKALYVEINGEKGKVLQAITPKTPIKVGDKVVVRMVVTADRPMEFVHIKDSRAACFEPTDVLSSYEYASGLRFYKSTKDLSTNFFVDYLPKGTYVLEYQLFANAAGTYGNGIANIQCMYAPEFTAHSKGETIEVK